MIWFGLGVITGFAYGVFITWKALSEAYEEACKVVPKRQPAIIEVKNINPDGQVIDVWLITGTMETSVNPN